MKDVGVLAAMTISVLGPASDVDCFFNSVVFFLENGKRGSKYPSVTEKLYCRSLSESELAELKVDLESIRVEFDGIPADGFDKGAFGVDEGSTRLLLNGNTLADIFARFFKVILDAVECSDAFHKEFNEYVPLRLGFTDAPDYIFDVNRPEDLYNSIASDELPFWRR
ncbi:Imm70 family immunity protein [Stenotrophomonas maltophilia]|uniref:Imm70 family immunity protein n=1 Tax=Stenotrophomonas maltophilia TaxID=40324 RepID=UPI002E78D16C|nr:Imm70 family immunity protein [Stenotrophomonas maltophilia]